MKKEQKQMLKIVFEAPISKRKEQFLTHIEEQTDFFAQKSSRQHTTNFLLAQIGYISKWVWIASFAAFLAAVITGIFVPDNMLWMMSAVMPLLAVTGVLETVRSEIYGMSELEQASRYNLRSILFARLEIVGMVHFLLFSMGVLLVYTAESGAFLYSAVYLFVPYLLTSGGCLFLVRHLRGREGAYGAAAFAALIAFLPQILSYWRELLYGAEHFKWWLALFFLLLVFNALQYRKTINNSEDLSWNLK